MKTLLSIILVSFTLASEAQIISRFTWASNPLTTAATGPNGTSVSSSAVSTYVGGTIGYAINPGLPNKNIDLVIPGASFDIPAMELSVDFRREESEASFFKRGSLFNFGMNGGKLSVNFTTNNGSTPGSVSVNSGNIVTIADDHSFHNYKFRYDNNTGIGRVYVDGTIVYTYTGVAGRSLYWTGAGNVIVGENMDATSRNLPILANLTVQNPSSHSTLPVELVSFHATAKNSANLLTWKTTKEMNVSGFIVERSSNGTQFAAIQQVAANGSFEAVQQYQITDIAPINGANYYRLKMVDNDGTFKYSDIIKINSAANGQQQINCFPNPATTQVNLQIANAQAGSYTYMVTTLDGRIIKAASAQLANGTQQISIDLNNAPSGLLMIRLVNGNTNKSDAFKIVKN